MSTAIQPYDSDLFTDPADGLFNHYSSVDLASQAVLAMEIPSSDRLKRLIRPTLDEFTNFQEWIAGEAIELNSVVFYIGYFLAGMPVVVDMAFDVDDGGYTARKATPCRSTAWIQLAPRSQLYLRFSEARTARHHSGALRTPVMGGYALEVTRRPSSDDPRDFVTALVFGKRKEHNANYPWVPERDAEVFSFLEYVDTPYSAGPLYNGHPNKIDDPDHLHQIMMVVRRLLVYTMR